MTFDSIPTRKACGMELVRLGSEIENLIVLDADISKSTYSSLFKEKFPNRHINVGIAEQNMVGIAAGLSLCGYIPVCMTYAVFASMRALEQIRTNVCYPNLNVKFFVSHGGLTPGSDGATHQAVEDLSIMRSIPNIKVAMPCDDLETRMLVREALSTYGPMYIRLTRCSMSVVYERGQDFKIGKAILLHDGMDATIFAIGDMVIKALEARKVLIQKGISVMVYDMHTVKPIDVDAIIKAAKQTGAIVSVEDNNILGGLGSAIAESVSGSYPVPLIRVGIRDTFGQSGDYEKLLKKYHMSTDDIVEAVIKSIKMKNGGL